MLKKLRKMKMANEASSKKMANKVSTFNVTAATFVPYKTYPNLDPNPNSC